MKTKLHIETKGKRENDEAEPVSPTGQYFNSKTLSICILAILEFEVPIDDSRAIPLLRDVFLPISTRFSSIMISDTAGVRQWKKVEVNLEDHVNVPSFPEGLSNESYDDYFDEYLTKISMEKLPQNRPLWEVHILKYPTSKAAGHLIFKLHHALGDGYSLMGALLSCVQRADNPSLPLTFPSSRAGTLVKSNNPIMGFMSLVPRTLSAIYRGVCDFGSFLKSTYAADDQTPIRSGNESLGFHQLKISTLALSIDQIKLIKTNLGTTVNDAITGIIFLGTRLYMQETHAKFSNSRSTVTVLFNTRNVRGYMSVKEMMNSDTKIWGNKFSYLQILLPELTPKKFSNPLVFVYEAQKLIMRKKNSPAIYLTAQYLEIVRRLKGSEAIVENIHTRLIRSSMGISNMIGPTEQVALADHPIKGMYFMSTGIPKSLIISVMSYTQTLRIAVGVEKGFIDTQRLLSCIENAFKMIYEAATKGG